MTNGRKVCEGDAAAAAAAAAARLLLFVVTRSVPQQLGGSRAEPELRPASRSGGPHPRPSPRQHRHLCSGPEQLPEVSVRSWRKNVSLLPTFMPSFSEFIEDKAKKTGPGQSGGGTAAALQTCLTQNVSTNNQINRRCHPRLF